MMSGNDFIKQSLALRLFLTYYEEHHFFLKQVLLQKIITWQNKPMPRRAFDRMMNEVVALSD